MRKPRRGERDPAKALIPEVAEALDGNAAPPPSAPTPLDVVQERVKEEVAGLLDAEVLSLMRQEVRSTAMLRALGVPEGMDGGAAEEWVTSQLPQARVMALAIQQWAMRFGTVSQALRASEKILEITEKDKNVGGVAPLVLVNVQGGGDVAITPWERLGAGGSNGHREEADDVDALPARVDGAGESPP
jgi:hypothetical protein